MFRSGDFNDQGNFIMFRKLHQLTLSAALIAASVVSELNVADAMPILPINNSVKVQPTDVLPVQYMGNQRSGLSLRWQFGRDGNRCRSRFGDCRHYYRGYYYETPWWTIPLILGDQMTRRNYGNAHVRWCLSRYHSYNPRTDLWLGNSGRRYRCNSPY
jgi:BA14K-like protein